MFLKPLLYRCIYRSQHTVPSPEKKLELRRRRRVRCSRAFAAGTDHEPRLRQRAVATATTVAAGAGLRATSAREGARLCKLFRLPYGYTTTRRRPPPLLFPASTTVSRHSAVAFTGLRLGIARFAFVSIEWLMRRRRGTAHAFRTTRHLRRPRCRRTTRHLRRPRCRRRRPVTLRPWYVSSARLV